MIIKFIILTLLVFCEVLRVECNGKMGMMESSMGEPSAVEPSKEHVIETEMPPVVEPPKETAVEPSMAHPSAVEPIFTVVGSKTLRADEPYKCAITNHGPINGADVPDLTLTVGLEGVGFNGQEFSLIQNATVPSGKTQTFKLKLMGLVPGVFNLVARTQSISKSVQLYFNKQLVSVYIQLSKPVYGISDLIEFRVFILNSRTKPYKIADTSTIRILDPSNNQIKAWKNPSFKQGLYEGQWQLSEALTGEWTVLVEADGQVSTIYL